MIQANELRIGNWVECRGLYSGYKQVTAITDQGEMLDTHRVIMVGENYGEFLTDLHPIPLSPEILAACGFTLTDEQGQQGQEWTHVHGQSVFLSEGQAAFTDDHYYIYGKWVDYLHQLQNLFFALTGTELTFHPPHTETAQND